MSDIQQCQDLIAQLGNEYSNEDRTTFVDVTPEKILQTSTMALWAQSTSGQRQINLGLPSLKTWLKNLASSGPGRGETYQGVRFKFVKRKFLNKSPKELQLIISKEEPNSRTTTPLSSLD
ncbi:hypothetical protein N7523_010086 [Penicillium sp. IBT 18751x]|nr:hypothetical protein N7523_010086 [Penicillium sp. IBT 18751x]